MRIESNQIRYSEPLGSSIPAEFKKELIDDKKIYATTSSSLDKTASFVDMTACTQVLVSSGNITQQDQENIIDAFQNLNEEDFTKLINYYPNPS